MNNTGAYICGFSQVGQAEKTLAFVLLSSTVQADRMLSTDEQIINFFILYLADSSGRCGVEFPPCTKPWTLYAILKTIRLLAFVFVPFFEVIY